MISRPSTGFYTLHTTLILHVAYYVEPNCFVNSIYNVFFLNCFLNICIRIKIKKKYMAEHLEEWVGMKDLK